MQTKNLRTLFLYAGILAIATYLFTIHKYAYNMPAGDDYDAILDFLNHYVQSDLKGQLELFFTQHNEHRILLTHLFSILDLYIFKEINFLHLIWAGTLGWFLSIAAFWQFSKREGISNIELIPVGIILLSFSHYEMMTWAMTSIQQYYQVFFGILAIGYMTKNRFLLSMIFYILAIFTSGGGMSLVPLANLYYLLHKQWRKLAFCAAITLATLITYFILLPYAPPGSNKILQTLEQPQIFIGYMVGFIGGLGNIQELGPISFLICGLFLLALFFAKAKLAYKKYPFLFWICVYVIITAILAALNRSNEGIQSSGDSRYSEYSLLFLSCIYLIYVASAQSQKMGRNITFIAFVISLGLFSFWHLRSIPQLVDRHYWLTNDIKTHPNWEHAKSIKNESVRLGIFRHD
jgi:hypothetical protein